MGSTDTAASRLFAPLPLGSHTLSNRLVMAPLTRFRANDAHVQLPFVKDYYTQRACVPGTLIITEATFISPRASGYPNVPGVWSDEQVAAWREIVESVHGAGGVIFLQLWALGRAADKAFKEKEDTGDVVSASAVPMSESATVPRELREDEIWEYVAEYARAAKNAVEGAGFDGVEIHGANGYLVDQFTQSISNHRSDSWGGSIANRSRFGLEVAKAVVAAVGAHRTGIRLSPFSTFQGMKMDDPIPQFSHLMAGLKEMSLAYVHLVESRISGNADVEGTEKCDPLISLWGSTSPILLAGGFRPDSARRAADQEYKDVDLAVVFGRYFISNPDLVFRMQHGVELAKYDRGGFYNPKSPEGYVDYEFSEEWKERNAKL